MRLPIVLFTFSLLAMFVPKTLSAAPLKLPGYYNPKELNFSPIGFSDSAILDLTVTLPPGQKLNRRAPSAISIYEKKEHSWQKTSQVSLNNILYFGQEIRVQKNITFESPSGDIAIGGAIYHCDDNKSSCVIDYYQGLIKRKAEASSKRVSINVQATTPSF